MKAFIYIVMAIAPLTIASRVDSQGYSATTSTGLKLRIHADTTWVAFRNGNTTRAILRTDTLIVTTESAGTSSTATWLLGPDSARVLRYAGNPPFRTIMPTAFVMRDWEFARLYRSTATGIDGPTYTYSRIRPAFTARIHGDTVWMDYANGDRYRSVLRGDTLAVLRQVRQRPRTETWLIKGDSADRVDPGGRILTSVPKAVVLAPREIAEAKQRMQWVRP